MGYLQASGMAEAINKEWIDLRTGLHWHLTSNHYPPLPTALVDTAVIAIERANAGDFDSEIELPPGIAFRAKTSMNVYEVIESLHLDAYLTYEKSSFSLPDVVE